MGPPGLGPAVTSHSADESDATQPLSKREKTTIDHTATVHQWLHNVVEPESDLDGSD